jgi:hypothetical protein
MTKTEYIQKMYSILVPMCAKYGYHNVACAMIAQSLQEGWNSELARKYFNYWGMKGESKDWKGPKVAMNNKAKTDPAVYRVYYSMEQGCEGYFKFLAYARYRPLKNCATDIDYLDKIGPCGWNGNVGYGDRCIRHLQEVYSALANIPKTEQWQVGQTYTTQQDLNIRTEPNGDTVPFNQRTADGQKHAFISPSGSSVLRRGTRVTVQDIKSTGSAVWLKIPSGWICGKNSKNIYVV